MTIVVVFYFQYLIHCFFFSDEMSSSIISQKRIKVRRAIISEGDSNESNPKEDVKREVGTADSSLGK